MTDFITNFKNKANNKALTSSDIVARCVYKSIKAKAENKKQLTEFFIKKAFTPGAMDGSRTYPYQALDYACLHVVDQMTPRRRWNSTLNKYVVGEGMVLGDTSISSVLNEEEIILFKELVDGIRTDSKAWSK